MTFFLDSVRARACVNQKIGMFHCRTNNHFLLLITAIIHSSRYAVLYSTSLDSRCYPGIVIFTTYDSGKINRALLIVTNEQIDFN